MMSGCSGVVCGDVCGGWVISMGDLGSGSVGGGRESHSSFMLEGSGCPVGWLYTPGLILCGMICCKSLSDVIV